MHHTENLLKRSVEFPGTQWSPALASLPETSRKEKAGISIGLDAGTDPDGVGKA